MKTTTTMRYLRVAAVGLLAWSACLSASADYKDTVLSKNPKGYWRFSNTNAVPPMVVATNFGTLGAAGNGLYMNGASTVTGPIASTPGETAPKFDGLNQWVEVPFNSALNPGSAFSVEAWESPYEVDNWDNQWTRVVVCTFSGAANGGGYRMMQNAGN